MRLSGGRTWWAHVAFTRINIEPIILRKKIEERRVLCAFASKGECPVAVCAEFEAGADTARSTDYPGSAKAIL